MLFWKKYIPFSTVFASIVSANEFFYERRGEKLNKWEALIKASVKWKKCEYLQFNQSNSVASINEKRVFFSVLIKKESENKKVHRNGNKQKHALCVLHRSAVWFRSLFDWAKQIESNDSGEIQSRFVHL